ncbi:MAG: hypothetical protein QUU85_03875 [Candidatus Eisenbacteria bacterium]|nr:hypothetical protein [Candidatus Eisenbacteria bacterium]
MFTFAYPILRWIQEATWYLIGRSSPHKEVAAIVAPIEAACQAVEEAEKPYAVARRIATAARAMRDHVADTLDAVIRGFGQAAREHTRSDFRAIPYATYLPHGTTGLIAENPASKARAVRVLIGNLENEKDPTLRSFLGPLTASVTALEEEVRKVEDAVAAEKLAWADFRQARAEWVATYREIYNKVRAYFRARPRDAERYFLSQKGRKVKAVPADEAEPGAGEEEAPDIEGGAGNAAPAARAAILLGPKAPQANATTSAEGTTNESMNPAA